MLDPKQWAGQTVVCIASGPSLTKRDCELVQQAGLSTVAVNSSWKLAPFAAAVYGGDEAFWQAYGKELSIPAEKWTCSRQAASKFGLKWHMASGPYNSGSRAIQFALERGAKRVILLGYDCSLEDGTHWHGDHEHTPNPTTDRVAQWHKHFAAVALQAKVLKATVINCSRKTALEAFEKGALEEELRRCSGATTLVQGMYGLGDNIYQRAFVKQMPGAYVVTPWPELYSDLDVKAVKPQTRLRTQLKNVRESKEKWHPFPKANRTVQISYGARELANGSIVSAMKGKFGVAPGSFDLPDFGPSPVSNRPYAIVRPVTVRSEWRNPARSPRPEYVAAAAEELRRRGYYVVSLADLEAGQEWLVPPAPPCDERIHKGEWKVKQLLSAIRHASVVVGGVGWIVPACIATRTPLYCVLGGCGGHNAPEKITDPSMDLTRVGWAIPDKFCRCSNNMHECEKEIRGFDQNFRSWLDGQGLLGASVHRPGVAPRVRHGVLPSQAAGHAV